MRVFVATPLCAEAAAFYDSLAADVASRVPGVLRPIPTGSAHLTHAFLGDVPVSAVSRIERAVQAVADVWVSFEIELGPPVLPRAGRAPRLVMAPVLEGSRLMNALSGAIVRALRDQGGFRELPMPKDAHVTLARIVNGTSTTGLDRLRRDLAARRDDRHVRVSSVQLVRSTLTPAGPVYDTLWTQVLRGRDRP